MLIRKLPEKNIQPITAIPSNAFMIIKANGLTKALSALSENQYWLNIKNNSWKQDIQILKSSLDSICLVNSSLEGVLNDSAIYISLHQNNNNPLGLLIYMPFGSNSNLEKIRNSFTLLINKQGLTCSEYKPGQKNKPVQNELKSNLIFFIEKGILIAGNFEKNITDAIIQLKTKKSLLTDTSFAKVYSTSGKNITGNIFINLPQLASFISGFIQPGNRDNFKKAMNFKGWAAFDLNLEHNFISLHGFSMPSSVKTNWLKVLKNEHPMENHITEAIPASSVFYGSLFISDPYNYLLMLKESARNDKNLSEKLKKIRLQFGINIDEKTFETISEAIIMDISLKKNDNYDVYCILKTKGNLEAFEFIETLNKTKPKKNKPNLLKPLETDSTLQSTLICKIPCDNLPPVLFGQVFNCGKYPVAVNYKEYVVFGSSEESLNFYLDELKHSKNILSDTSYINIASNLLSSRSNLTLYFNAPKIWDFICSSLMKDARENIENNFTNKQKNITLGVQLSGNSPYIYNNIFLTTSYLENQGIELNWITKLDTSVYLPPVVISNNHYPETLYFLQDKLTNIYLLSASGKIHWKHLLGEKILGRAYPIDYYKNGKIQILFNTAERLYLLDRNGKNIKGFPIKFRNKATNELTIADFDNNLNYRIYLAFENKTVQVFNKDGHKVEGWKFKKTEDMVKQPIQLFKISGKDYILFSDSSHIYLLNRKGEPCLKLKQSFTRSSENKFYAEEKNNFYRLITTDNTGKVSFIYPDGHIEKLYFRNFSKNHYFELANLDGDDQNEFIFSDSSFIYVYNQQKKLVFSTNLSVLIDQKPFIIKSGKNNSAVFIASTNSGKIYMIDKNGKIIKGFPINGNFPMNVLSLSVNNYSYSIFTENSGNLYNYLIQ